MFLSVYSHHGICFEYTKTMKIAIPCWQDIVSPVFDVAGTVLLVEIANGRERNRHTTALSGNDPLARVRQMVILGADMLICGAISGQLESMLRSAGVRVVSNICGPVEDVLGAFLKDALIDTSFLMPGCYGKKRRLRNRYGR
jgi:predicted Fe-Mo cluster-binding NifX family protein